jgi:F0F1-type ATP synthase membrane subunit b/b'
MNPILVFLIIIAAALLWVVCSFLYKPIGRFFNRLIQDAKDAISEETKEKGEG